jgi:uncharacterized protein (TIGR02145 family)
MKDQTRKVLFMLFFVTVCVLINAQQTITDIDGNIYNTIIIGSQKWMKENLKTTRYRNGDGIGTTHPATYYYMGESTPKYQWAYNGIDSLADIYGRLYTWYAATDNRNVCPTGWHLPSYSEFKTLIDYLGGGMVAHGKLKETDTIHWRSPNADATNESGFTGLPGGSHWDSVFLDMGTCGHYWSASQETPEWSYRMLLNFEAYDATYFLNSASPKIGWAIRCIEDPIADSVKYLEQTAPGNNPAVFAPEIITGYVHGTIAISPRGDELYWVVNPSTERIMYSKFENGNWTVPVLADFVIDFLTNNNGNPTFSPDGKKLFFCSDRPGGMGNYDSWYIERTDSGWSPPINAGAPYNTADADLTPLFTNKGNAYHLGYNNNYEEITSCYKYSNNKFTDPAPMDILPEYGPWWTIFISPEEDYLIFASGNDADLYIRFKDKEGQWGNPISMGDKINTLEWERFPVVSPDGKYLFFTRGGSDISNLFWVSTSIIDSLKNTVTEIKASQANKKVIVFPNPLTCKVTILFGVTQVQKSLVEIYNLQGAMVFSKIFHNTPSATIDLTVNPAGIYVVKVIADGVCYEQKVLKE